MTIMRAIQPQTMTTNRTETAIVIPIATGHESSQGQPSSSTPASKKRTVPRIVIVIEVGDDDRRNGRCRVPRGASLSGRRGERLARWWRGPWRPWGGRRVRAANVARVSHAEAQRADEREEARHQGRERRSAVWRVGGGSAWLRWGSSGADGL